MTDPSANPPRVTELRHSEIPQVVDVLCAAFRHYPVMQYVLGPTDAPDRLRRLVELFVGARLHRGETFVGVRGEEHLLAAAMVSVAPERPVPNALRDLQGSTWEDLGVDARVRYERFAVAAAPLVPEAAHLHLNMIGVHPRAQGRGLGRALLDHVHRLSLDDPGSVGVSLSTEVESNVTLYRHFGYECLGFARVEEAFTTWAMFRRNPVEFPEPERGSNLPIDG